MSLRLSHTTLVNFGPTTSLKNFDGSSTFQLLRLVGLGLLAQRLLWETRPSRSGWTVESPEGDTHIHPPETLRSCGKLEIFFDFGGTKYGVGLENRS